MVAGLGPRREHEQRGEHEQPPHRTNLESNRTRLRSPPGSNAVSIGA
jgi:hypothetical protein